MFTFVYYFIKTMILEDLDISYSSIKESDLFGRYITNSHIEKCLNKFPKSMVSILGHSVEEKPIYSLKFGNGPIKILMWSQMHGNESTTTKALFDCFNLFLSNNELAQSILKNSTMVIVPILNPDGAEAYTRVNANKVDLNRDAQNLSQPESKILRMLYEDFKPQYCFNLHGQRTIFGAGDMKKSATLAFLSPSQDVERSLTSNRKVAMEIISEINKTMQCEIPNGIARYDDGFNLNCVGDTFQSFGVPTLLYEAGHFPNDYEREKVRELVFSALLVALKSIITENISLDYIDYFKIPENKKTFFDIIVRNAKIENDIELKNIAFQYEERLEDDKVKFVAKVKSISKLDNHFGHKEIDAKGNRVSVSKDKVLKPGNEIDFVVINNENIVLNIH